MISGSDVKVAFWFSVIKSVVAITVRDIGKIEMPNDKDFIESRLKDSAFTSFRLFN